MVVSGLLVDRFRHFSRSHDIPLQAKMIDRWFAVGSSHPHSGKRIQRCVPYLRWEGTLNPRSAFHELLGPGFDRDSGRLCTIGRLRHVHTRRRRRLLLRLFLVIFVYLQEWAGGDAFPFR